MSMYETLADILEFGIEKLFKRNGGTYYRWKEYPGCNDVRDTRGCPKAMWVGEDWVAVSIEDSRRMDYYWGWEYENQRTVLNHNGDGWVIYYAIPDNHGESRIGVFIRLSNLDDQD